MCKCTKPCWKIKSPTHISFDDGIMELSRISWYIAGLMLSLKIHIPSWSLVMQDHTIIQAQKFNKSIHAVLVINASSFSRHTWKPWSPYVTQNALSSRNNIFFQSSKFHKSHFFHHFSLSLFYLIVMRTISLAHDIQVYGDA